MLNSLKFHYLKSSVTGNAALLINRFQNSSENYTAIWKMLVTEYDDKRALIHTCFQSFVSLPKGKSESVTELKKLTVRHHIPRACSVSNLGCHVDYWHPILVYIISEKCDLKTRTEWNLKRGDTKEYAKR
jgi:hypothetical protein